MGESLKAQGLVSLADWTEATGKPGITGLIVEEATRMPGTGYFRLFHKKTEDFQWWEEQIRLSVAFDWSPFLLQDSAPITSASTEPKGKERSEEAKRKTETVEETPDSEPVAPTDSTDQEKPERETVHITRVVRDSALAREIKRMHGFRCQICGTTISLPDGSLYAEAHHLRPLGNPHNGNDESGNIMCVCPNHHAELDLGARRLILSDLRLLDGHSLNPDFIRYHNEFMYGKAY